MRHYGFMSLMVACLAIAFSASSSASILQITVSGELGTNAADDAAGAPDNPDTFIAVFLIQLAEAPTQPGAETNIWVGSFGEPAIVFGSTTLFENGVAVYGIHHDYGTVSLTDSSSGDQMDLRGGEELGEADFSWSDVDGGMLGSNTLDGLLGIRSLSLGDVDAFEGEIWAYGPGYSPEIYRFNAANGLQVTSVDFEIFVAPVPASAVLAMVGLGAVAVGRARQRVGLLPG